MKPCLWFPSWIRVWWVDTIQQLGRHPVARSLPPPPWDVEENQKAKSEKKLMDWDSLVSERKKKKRWTRNQRHSLSTSQQQTVAQPVSEQWLLWKHPHLQFSCRVWCHMVWNIPLVSWGQLSQLCPLPASCPLPAYSLRWQVVELRVPW